MTTLLWLAASSLVWGGILFGAMTALLSRGEVSGQTQQWMWRGAGMLLIAPWIAVPLIDVLAPGLALSLTPVMNAAAAPAAAPAGETAILVDSAISEAPVHEGAGIVLPWVEIVFAVVVAGWLVRFGLARLAALRMRGLLKQASPAPLGASRNALKFWTRRLSLRREPDLRVVRPDVSPFSLGALRPKICLPEGIEHRMQPDQLGLIVGHECIHVARGDGWWRPAERALADVLWFNPFAWIIRRELDLARELACDEAVVAASSSRRAYARTLRDVAGMAAGIPNSAPAASMSLSGGGRLLALRIKRTLAAAGQAPGRAVIAAAIVLAFAAAPMAIAQALLIEAAKPPAPPPPPPAPPAAAIAPTPPAAAISPAAPPSAPSPPAPVAPPTLADAPVTPAPVPIQFAPSPSTPPTPPTPPSAPAPVASPLPATAPVPAPAAAPIAPPAPPAPPTPAVAGMIKVKTGETLRTWFPARVAYMKGEQDSSRGYAVRLVQTEDTDTMQGCTMMLAGLTSVSVADGQTLSPGASIGVVGEHSSLAISCRSMTGAFNADGARVRAPRTVLLPRLEGGPEILAQPNVLAVPSQRIRPVEAVRFQSTPPVKLEGAPNAVLETGARRTMGYGFNVNETTKVTGLHQGVDFAARLGTPVHAPGAATVTFAGDKDKFGNVVELSLGGDHAVRFAHLGEIIVKLGDSISAGQVIGTVGDDEYSTGPHLHFEYRYKGRAYDPEKVEGLILTKPS